MVKELFYVDADESMRASPDKVTYCMSYRLD
jgi:hypothetical protein